MKMEKAFDFKSLADRWPSSIISRTEISRFTGGAITLKYLQNLDSLGRGPAGRFRLGRRVCYHVSDVIAWLESRASKIDGRGRRPGRRAD